MTDAPPFACLTDFDQASLASIRHHLHANPELSLEETDTAEFVASRLEAWGYEVVRGVGGHGVVARMTAGSGTKSIAIRADMDALPITEQTGLDYASRAPGKMHACGHDGHTAMLLGAAEYLARTRRFDGTINLIFQPAEEAGQFSGAKAMIADGLFERFPFDAIFGLHNHPGAPPGTFLTRSGPLMAASDRVTIVIRGPGGHAARPHLTVDPVVAACSLVMALQTIVSRNIDPIQTAVLTIGVISAGEVANVIPQFAKLVLSVRSFSPEIRSQLEDRIRALAEAHGRGYGADVEIDYVRGYPVIVNAEDETRFAEEVIREVVGPDHLAECVLLPGSEDFAYYLEHKKGAFLRLGNGVQSAALHHPEYDFCDDSLIAGAAVWARLAERYLQHDTGRSPEAIGTARPGDQGSKAGRASA